MPTIKFSTQNPKSPIREAILMSEEETAIINIKSIAHFLTITPKETIYGIFLDAFKTPDYFMEQLENSQKNYGSEIIGSIWFVLNLDYHNFKLLKNKLRFLPD